MIRTILYPVPVLVRSHQPVRPAATRSDLSLFGVAAALAFAAIACLAFVGPTLSPPGLAPSLANGARDVALDATLTVRLDGWNARLDAAALYETGLGPDGQASYAEIPLEVQLTRGGPLPGQRDVTLRPAGRLLRPDTSYRL